MNWIWIVLAIAILAGIFGFLPALAGAVGTILKWAFWILFAVFVIGLIRTLLGRPGTAV